jgi:hypothetical protein
MERFPTRSLEELQEREQLLKLEPVKQGPNLVQSFRQFPAARKEGGLEEWIKQAEAAAGNPFKGFSRESAAITLPLRKPLPRRGVTVRQRDR